MIQVITSFNQHYYDLIGKDSLKSWLDYWSDDFCMTCYVEDFSLPFQHPRITEIDFSNLDPDYFEFQQSDFHDSVKRFSKKAYSTLHAMYYPGPDWFIWLDADVITTDYVTKELWDPLLDSKYLCTYLGVTYHTDKSGNPGNWLVPETGVFAVNRKNSWFDDFRFEYRRRYHTRDYQDLRRFYDNDVFGAAVDSVPMSDVNDLCKNFAKPYKTPLKHTVLGPYLTHYKAKHSKAEYAQGLVQYDSDLGDNKSLE